ncbi:hypothetical protein CYMTET_54850, partial [Cymbomonas tetramitiformis]
MKDEFLISSNEKEFIIKALESEQRVDGRRPFDVRKLNVKFGPDDGAVEVQLGQTRVAVVVTADLSEPYGDRPNEGTINFAVEFSPMASPAFETGRPSEDAVEVVRVLERSLRESGAIDTEALCVLAGRKVWNLKVIVHILDHGGALLDTASMAVLAALVSMRVPDVSIGGETGQEVIVHPPQVKEPVPLNIHHLPLAITLAFFGDGELVVVDPSMKEEAAMSGSMTVCLNPHEELCTVQKGGGVAISPAQLMRCIRIAAAKVKDRALQLKEYLAANDQARQEKRIKRRSAAPEEQGAATVVGASEVGKVVK